MHPDEQIELLQKQKNEGKSGMPELDSEREWVLPSHLREKWSLKRFGKVFDSISSIPSWSDGELLFHDVKESGEYIEDETFHEANVSDSKGGTGLGDADLNQWRTSQPKRLLLATLDDDSSIVYYIVHDGIVKPRQN